LIKDGVELSFVSDDWRSAPGSAQSLLESILEYLALVQMTAGAESPQHAGALKLSVRD
jgi:hypothetical protein